MAVSSLTSEKQNVGDSAEDQAWAEGRAYERERCAKIAEQRAIAWERDDRSVWTKATEARAIAAEIRNSK